MKSINFDIGNYREYAINGDETRTIRIDVSDLGFVGRIQTAMDEIQKYADELSATSDDAQVTFENMDQAARKIINKAFDSDVCEAAFGDKNCFSIARNGSPIIINFLNAFVPVIKNDFENALKTQRDELTAKTAKYIEPVIGESAAGIDISGLTDEQKNAMLRELLR